MTTRDGFDRLLSDWLVTSAGTAAPDYLEQTLEAIGSQAQRSAWAFPRRWLPLPELRVRASLAIPILAMLGLLLLAGLAVFLAAGGRPRVPTQLPSPFGLAKPGLLAYDSDGQIVLAEPDGSRTHPLHPSEPSLVHPKGIPQFGATFSPDGTRVAFWQQDDWKPLGGGAETAADLWVVDVDGSNAVNLTPDLLVAPWPGSPAGAWSPDSSAIAFTADKDAGLYVVPADGSEPPRLLDTGFLGLLSTPAWSPDGSRIAFTGHERLADGDFGVPKVHVIGPDGSGLEQVTSAERGEGNGQVPQWSPDGRQLLYWVNDPPWSPHDPPQANALPTELVIAERGSSGWTDRVVVPTSLNWPATFSNGGSRIAFIRSRDGMFPGDLFVVGVDGSEERVISDRLVNLSSPCWSPDDRSIAVLTGPTPVSGEYWSRLPDQVYTLFPVDTGSVVEIPAGRVDGSWACSWQRLAP